MVPYTPPFKTAPASVWNGTQLRVFIVVFGGLSATAARRSSMQTLLAGVRCSGVLGLLPGVPVRKSRAALAETRLLGLNYAALPGLMKAEVGRPQRHESVP